MLFCTVGEFEQVLLQCLHPLQRLSDGCSIGGIVVTMGSPQYVVVLALEASHIDETHRAAPAIRQKPYSPVVISAG